MEKISNILVGVLKGDIGTTVVQTVLNTAVSVSRGMAGAVARWIINAVVGNLGVLIDNFGLGNLIDRVLRLLNALLDGVATRLEEFLHPGGI